MTLKPQPSNIILYGVHILLAFLNWVSIVETQVTNPTVFFSDAKIQANRFGMPDVKITIWFGWESGAHASFMLINSKILGDHVADKIRGC